MAVAAYDTLEFVCNAARTRLNDAIASIGGDILTDNQPFTLQIVNDGWRKLQEFLQKLGFLRFTKDVFFLDLPATPGSPPDPDLEPFLNWTGYNDGSTLHTGFTLPADFISPKRIDERVNGSGTAFIPMDPITGGLPLVPKGVWNRIWDWRNDTIWLPGTIQAQDLHLYYYAFLADFVAASTTPFASQTVPILRCSDSFSAYIAKETAMARGDLDAQQFIVEAENAATALVARENPSVAIQEPPSSPGGKP